MNLSRKGFYQGMESLFKSSQLQRDLSKQKIDWFCKYYPLGLRIKVVIADTGEYQGILEYIPGEYALRPVNASGYMFIHCVFVGFKSKFKGKGYASALLDECIIESRNAKMNGGAVVTRDGSFMAKKDPQPSSHQQYQV